MAFASGLPLACCDSMLFTAGRPHLSRDNRSSPLATSETGIDSIGPHPKQAGLPRSGVGGAAPIGDISGARKPSVSGKSFVRRELGHTWSSTLEAIDTFQASRPARVAAVLFVSLFALYNLNFREIGATDTIPGLFLPSSILTEGEFNLDKFIPLFRADRTLRQTAEFGGGIQWKGDQLLSSYPVGGAILATPVYALPVALGWLEDWQDHRIAGKVAASLLTALSAAFLFLAARKLASDGVALVVAIAYGVGTNAWTVASQSMWQHGPGMLCLSLGTLLALQLDERPRPLVAASMGIVLGMAVVCRLLNVIPALLLGCFVLIRHHRQIIGFALPFAAIGPLAGRLQSLHLRPDDRRLQCGLSKPGSPRAESQPVVGVRKILSGSEWPLKSF